jgi:hypothetical protein
MNDGVVIGSAAPQPLEVFIKSPQGFVLPQ